MNVDCVTISAAIRLLLLSVLLPSIVGCSDDPASHPDEAADSSVQSLRRLSARELDGTISDILQIEAGLIARLPADTIHNNFDNQRSALRTNRTWLRSAEVAIRDVVSEALSPDPNTSARYLVAGHILGGTTGEVRDEIGSYGFMWHIGPNDRSTWQVTLRHSGRYRFSAYLNIPELAADDATITVLVDDASIPVQWVREADHDVLTAEVALDAGTTLFQLRSDGDFGGLATIDYLTLNGPVDDAFVGVIPRERSAPCAAPDQAVDSGCARSVIEAVVRDALRSEYSAAAAHNALDLYEAMTAAGSSSEDALVSTLAGVLTSPGTLFLVDRDWPAGSWQSAHQGVQRAAFLVWGRAADAEADVPALAPDGAWDQVAVERLVDQMLADPRAVSVVDDFATRWLGLDTISDAEPDPEMFPGFNGVLRAQMLAEVRRAVSQVFFGGGDLRTLFTSTSGEVGPELAAHYGDDILSIEEGTAHFDPARRTGLQSRAGMMMGLSNPTSTHPTKRGLWLLDRVLCDLPPPPPADVDPIPEPDPDSDILTGRDRVREHLADSTCASCHVVMDGLGLMLENYDATGQWRDTENGVEIDAGYEFPAWGSLQGASDLGAALAEDARFPTCFVSHLYTYAFGEPPAENDRLVESVTRDFVDGGYTLRAALVSLIASERFLTGVAGDEE